MGHALAVLVGVLALIAGRPAQAVPAAPPEDLEVHLGFQGALKVGVPIPLDVSVPPLPSAGPAKLIIDAPALAPQTGAVVTSTVVPFQAVSGTVRTFHVPVAVSDLRRPLTIRVVISGREVLRRDLPIDPSLVGGRLLVALSDRHGGLESLHHLPGRVLVAYVAARTLPRSWQEYAAVDLLMIRDLDPDEMEEAQRQALVIWVRLGGRLLVIPRAGVPVPAFLQGVLPAVAGQPRSISLAVLASRYGDPVPPGPYVVTTLVPRPGADEVRADGVPVIASAQVGWGRVTVWGFDPMAPPFPEWSGHLRVWAEALGPPTHPRVDVEEIAGRFPDKTPLDPLVHVAVGAAVFCYIGVLFLLQRRRASAIGAAGSLVITCLGIMVFIALANGVRARSVTLGQVTFLEQAPGAPLAQVTSVAVVAVPYGGAYRVIVVGGLLAGPVGSSGDVQVALTSQGAVLSGRLRPERAARAFRALGAVSLATAGALTPDGRMLMVDLGTERLHHAELRWRGRVYLLGDLPAGRSSRELRPEQWRQPPEAEREDRLRGWLFRAPGREGADVIIQQTMPVLVGELERSMPAFALQDGNAPGQRLTILLVPLVGR